MTIDDIENTLPNGFHDAVIRKLDIDYTKREGSLVIEVNAGNIEDDQVCRRIGKLTLTDIVFFVIEPPDPNYPYKKSDGLWIASSGLVNSLKLPTRLPNLQPCDGFAHYFFINDWNAFIYLAAMDANFEWC